MDQLHSTDAVERFDLCHAFQTPKSGIAGLVTELSKLE
jgi:hypothetical protein